MVWRFLHSLYGCTGNVPQVEQVIFTICAVADENALSMTLVIPCVQEGHWRQLHEKSQYLEGWKATVLVARDSDQSDFWLTVAFATSDLTARGVDSDAYRDCFELPVSERLPVSHTVAVVSAAKKPFRPKNRTCSDSCSCALCTCLSQSPGRVCYLGNFRETTNLTLKEAAFSFPQKADRPGPITRTF